jgi:drug/metabolite transporter (DMT)-like permease
VGVAIYHASLNQGERTVPAGTASLLVNASPIFTALLARARLGERLGTLGTIGVVLGFSGVAILAGSTGVGVHLELGAALVLVSALAQALSFVMQKPLLGRLRPVDVTTWSVWIGTAALLPFAPQLLSTAASAPREAVLAAVYLGVFPGAIANALWAFVLSRVPASRAAAWLYAVAPLVMLMGWALLGESPTTAAIAGGVVTLAGVALTVKRPRPAVATGSAPSARPGDDARDRRACAPARAR